MALQRTSGHLIPVTINPSLEKANYIAKFRDQDTATLVKSLISETSTVVTIEGHVTATSLDVNYIDLNPQDDAPSFREGRQWYDNHKKSIAAFVDTGDVQVNYGREILIRIKNGTDQPILNGMVVTPYSKDGFIYPGEDDAVLVAPADCTIREACTLVAVATHDILPGNIGYATRIGEIGGLNNTGFAKGDLLYIDPENPGYLTKIKPLEGAFPLAIGSVQKVDDSEGVLVVDILNTNHTTEEVNTRGFPFSQRANTILNLNYTTRVFSITPTNGKFHYYVDGEKFLRYGTASVTIADVTGQHFIYFDKGVLIDTVDTTADKLFEILTKHCMVAQVYWDSLTQQAFHRGDKRYGINMGTETRYFLYREFGLQFISGCALNNFTIGDGSLDSHAQYTIDAGITQEADLRHTMSSTTGMAVFYRGPDGWARQYNDSFSILSAPAGRMYYNPITGSTGSLVQATSGNYVYYHVFVSNSITEAPFVIMGNYQYANKNEALQAKYLDAHELLIDDHPVKDKILIASILFRTGDTYTNSVKSIIIPVDGYNYLDWRHEALPSSTGGTGTNNHSLLANLDQDDHKQYALLSGRLGNVLKIDTIQEYSLNNGVDISEVKLKSGIVYGQLEGTATSLSGGAKGSIPYQTNSNVTGMLTIGAEGQVLKVGPDGIPIWGYGSDSTFVHDQITAASIWTINHNLGKYPSVTLATNFNGEWDAVWGEITYVDENTIQIDFESGITGRAFLN